MGEEGLMAAEEAQQLCLLGVGQLIEKQVRPGLQIAGWEHPSLLQTGWLVLATLGH